MEIALRTVPDLIFIDLQLPKIDGLGVARELRLYPKLKKTPIIIPSGHDPSKYRQAAMDAGCNDYLLKPIEFDRFLVAVNKVKKNQGEKQPPVESQDTKDFIFLNVQKKKVKILFSDILYIESQREYIKIVTTKKEYLSKMSTHEIEALLPGHIFKRVHRSFIISINKIDSYTAEDVEVNGIPIPIGRDYRDVLKNL